MRIQIESTEQITRINGQPCRAWKGVTENGVDCTVFVCLIAASAYQDLAELDAELLEQPPPVEALGSDPARREGLQQGEAAALNGKSSAGGKLP